MKKITDETKVMELVKRLFKKEPSIDYSIVKSFMIKNIGNFNLIGFQNENFLEIELMKEERFVLIVKEKTKVIFKAPVYSSVELKAIFDILESEKRAELEAKKYYLNNIRV